MLFNFARSRQRLKNLVLTVALVCAMVVGLTPGVAGAESVDALERRAADLVDRLEKELKAVRHEREALQQERKALEAQRSTGKGAAKVADAGAETTPPAADQDRKIDILTREIEQIKENVAVPATKELKSQYGMGPAASKVYSVARGLSIGGYGEALLSVPVANKKGSAARADAQRFVLYTGYKFSERIILNSELEFEHATSESTASSEPGAFELEFMYLDFLGWDWLNARAGLVLVPVGFINELHEPNFFHGANRPEVERQIIPTTWNNLGIGLHGVLPGDLQYRGYLSTSLNAKGFSSSNIRGGRQAGNEELAADIAGSFRLDYTPGWAPGLLVGGSAFIGDTGQQQFFGKSVVNANGDTVLQNPQRVGGLFALWDVHAQYRYRGLELRGLAAFSRLDDAGAISIDRGESIANRSQGYYLEAAYDLMPVLMPDLVTQYVAPFVRYEQVNPQESVAPGFTPVRNKNQQIVTVGVTYKPHPQVVLKLDYRNANAAKGLATDDVNAALGFVF